MEAGTEAEAEARHALGSPTSPAGPIGRPEAEGADRARSVVGAGERRRGRGPDAGCGGRRGRGPDAGCGGRRGRGAGRARGRLVRQYRRRRLRGGGAGGGVTIEGRDGGSAAGGNDDSDDGDAGGGVVLAPRRRARGSGQRVSRLTVRLSAAEHGEVVAAAGAAGVTAAGFTASAVLAAARGQAMSGESGPGGSPVRVVFGGADGGAAAAAGLRDQCEPGGEGAQRRWRGSGVAGGGGRGNGCGGGPGR